MINALIKKHPGVQTFYREPAYNEKFLSLLDAVFQNREGNKSNVKFTNILGEDVTSDIPTELYGAFTGYYGYVFSKTYIPANFFSELQFCSGDGDVDVYCKEGLVVYEFDNESG